MDMSGLLVGKAKVALFQSRRALLADRQGISRKAWACEQSLGQSFSQYCQLNSKMLQKIGQITGCT